jgi:hypothetical protein
MADYVVGRDGCSAVGRVEESAIVGVQEFSPPLLPPALQRSNRCGHHGAA